MALPWIIGGLAVATVAYLATDDDTPSYSSDRYDREREAQKRVEEEKNRQILIDINLYKKKEILYIENKYQSTIHIDTTESFSYEIHKILKDTSLSMLNHLTSKFGSSFISLNGIIKKDILDKHIEELESIFRNKVSEITFIDIENLDNIQVENIIGINIEIMFEKDLNAIRDLIELHSEENQISIFNRIKNIYLVEKTYQKFLMTCRKFHKLLKNENILHKIEEYILDNINDYQDNFNSYKVSVIDKDKTLKDKITVLEKEQEELKEIIHKLRIEKDV